MRPMIRHILSCAIVFAIVLLARSDPGAVSPNPPDASPGVHALFDLDAPNTGPFPSDWFTVEDPTQNTGLRVKMPLPDCSVRVSDCDDLEVINTLDGFNLQPRLSIPFDGTIYPASATSKTIVLISLGSTLGGDRGGRTVGINQVVWDPDTNTLHVESDELLDQHTRYALIVTRGLRDASGAPIEPTEAFRRFRQTVRGEYKHALLEAVDAARHAGIPEREIAAASVFTTESVTAVLEKIRDQIKAATPEPADFLLGPDGRRTVFSLGSVKSITFNQQVRLNPPGFSNVGVNLSLLDTIPGAVGTLAFGRYSSPDYEMHPGEFIASTGTRTGAPEMQGTNEIYFNLFLPSGLTPAGGWPVAIFGSGVASTKNAALVRVAASMAHHGIATIAIDAVGHGFGPSSALTVNQTVGGPVTFLSGGRGIDQNGDQLIGPDEGFSASRPQNIVFVTDGIRQTVADLMQLVRVIEVGMDVDGNGARDVDPSHIYYLGNSLGANIGTVLLAIEPAIQVGALHSAGSPVSENRRLGPGRSQFGQLLASRIPSLITDPGIALFGGIPVVAPRFTDNLPLRNGVPLPVRLADGTSYDVQSPMINTAAGAMAIQEVVEELEWVSQAGNAVAFAPYLRKAPLVNVPAKSVIYQFAKGDQGAPNPNMTAILRAGDLADRATYYRHDLAYAENALLPPPLLPKNPHGFMTVIEKTANATYRQIALAAQEQIAVFFASDGKEVIHPEPARFFEVPIEGPLPESLNFIP